MTTSHTGTRETGTVRKLPWIKSQSEQEKLTRTNSAYFTYLRIAVKDQPFRVFWCNTPYYLVKEQDPVLIGK